MPRRRKDRCGILDADNLVLRRVHHQQRLMQMNDVGLKRLTFGIFDQALADGEGATSKGHVGDAVAFDIIELPLEVVQHVSDIEGAPMVTIAFASGRRCAAASTAAPPNEWPMTMAGAR